MLNPNLFAYGPGFTRDGHVCEAGLYIGELALLRGGADEATRRLRTAAADCPKGFIEYVAAPDELRRRGVAP